MCVCVLTCCRPFHSFLEDDALAPTLCKGALSCSTSATSSSAGVGLTGLAGSFGEALAVGLLLRSSRMVRTSERYLQHKKPRDAVFYDLVRKKVGKVELKSAKSDLFPQLHY